MAILPSPLIALGLGDVDTRAPVYGVAGPVIAIGDILALAVAPAPTQDEPLDLALDPATGDYALLPDGEVAGVSGQARALMDFYALATTPAGSCLADPEHGNLLAALGAPMPDAADMAMRVAALAQSLADLQAARAAEGTPPGAAELVRSAAVERYDATPGAASVSILATFAAGAASVAVPVAGSLG